MRQRLTWLVIIFILLIACAFGIRSWTLQPEYRIYALKASDGQFVWSNLLPGNRASGIATGNGNIFVLVAATSDNKIDSLRLIAYHGADGHKLWEKSLDPAIYADTDLFSRDQMLIWLDGRVYVLLFRSGERMQQHNQLLVLDEGTGTTQWSLDGPYEELSTFGLKLVQAGSYLYTLLGENAPDGTFIVRLVALAPETGKEVQELRRLEYNRPEAEKLRSFSSPFLQAISGRVSLNTGQNVYIYDTAQGTLTFSVKGTRQILLGNILWVQEGQQLVAYDITSGVELHVTDGGAARIGCDSFTFGRFGGTPDTLTAYAFCDSAISTRRFFALDTTTASVRWQKNLTTERASSLQDSIVSFRTPVVSNSVVLTYSSDGTGMQILGLALDNGHQRWQFALKSTSFPAELAAADGNVYFTDQASRYSEWLTRLNPAWR